MPGRISGIMELNMKNTTTNWLLITAGILFPISGTWIDPTFINIHNRLMIWWFVYMALILIRVYSKTQEQ